MKVKHILFNISLQNLQDICDEQQKDGFMLERVVYYNPWESIAVFTKEEVIVGKVSPKGE